MLDPLRRFIRMPSVEVLTHQSHAESMQIERRAHSFSGNCSLIEHVQFYNADTLLTGCRSGLGAAIMVR